MVQQRRDVPPADGGAEDAMDVDEAQVDEPAEADQRVATPTMRAPSTAATTPRGHAGQLASRSTVHLRGDEEDVDLDFRNVPPRPVDLPEHLLRTDDGSTFLEAVQQRMVRRVGSSVAGSQTPVNRSSHLRSVGSFDDADVNAAFERELLRTPTTSALAAAVQGGALRTPGGQSIRSQTPSVTGARTPHRIHPANRPGFAPLPLVERLPMEFNDDGPPLLGRQENGHADDEPNGEHTSPARSVRSGIQVATTSDISDIGRETLVWGTSVDLQDLRRRFLAFLRTYVLQPTEAGEPVDYSDAVLGIKITADEPCYVQKARHLVRRGLNCMEIDCMHLSPGLYEKVTLWPQEVVPTLDLAASALVKEIATRERLPITSEDIHVRLWNLPDKLHMRQLSPVDIDRLVSVTGMVIRTSNLIPLMHQAVFFCRECGERHHEEIYDGHINEPERCSRCNKVRTLTIDHNLCHFTDSQIIKLQERPDDVPPGQSPQTLVVIAHQDLVDTINAGDRITVTGIYRATGMRSNPRQRSVKAVYRTHIDAMHFQRDHSNQLHNDYDAANDAAVKRRRQAANADAPVDGGGNLIEDEEEREAQLLDPARVAEIHELADKHDIYERLADAIAPSIYEHMDIKKAILLQVLGGTGKEDIHQEYGQRFRSNINILLCGDPGTSKSQLLQYVHKLVPRSQYTSGKGSSAVGLTAYITKDPETRQLALQTGALVLSDNGICCIDEFDKMSDSTRSILHEVMEQQTLSIAKAGIICQLNARTSILAAANPVESRWNRDRSIIENLQLPHTLLSRFDLIFLLLDTEDEVYDRRLAQHLISLYQTGRDDTVTGRGDGANNNSDASQHDLELSLLRDYLLYARKRVKPHILHDAKKELIDCYIRMRQMGKTMGVPSAYPRQLESLIRLAEAHSKVKLQREVTVENVREAYRLYREALKQAATDPTTGRVDISILTTGISNAARRQMEELTARLLEYVKQTYHAQQSVPFHKLYEDFVESTGNTFVRRDVFEDAVRKLQDDGYADLKAKNVVFNSRISA